MKLIFLDFDGVVLTSGHRYFEMGYFGADPEAIANLNNVIHATGAKIVVSSTYRHGESTESLRTRLRRWGVQGSVIDKTPSLWGQPRGREIQRFFDNWYETGYEEVESFVIFDDKNDMEHFGEYLVCTDASIGISEYDAVHAISILNHKAYEYVKRGFRFDEYDDEFKVSAGVTSCYLGLPDCEVCKTRKATQLSNKRREVIEGISVPALTCYKCADA